MPMATMCFHPPTSASGPAVCLAPQARNRVVTLSVPLLSSSSHPLSPSLASHSSLLLFPLHLVVTGQPEWSLKCKIGVCVCTINWMLFCLLKFLGGFPMFSGKNKANFISCQSSRPLAVLWGLQLRRFIQERPHLGALHLLSPRRGCSLPGFACRLLLFGPEQEP